MYRYETHLHTFPVSRCARAGVEESLRFYAQMGYAGVFITNHFLDGNINLDGQLPYDEAIEFYFSDYEQGCTLAEKLGIQVFLGVEISYLGTDFLIYGLDKAWFLAHPEIKDMDKRQELRFMMDQGALVIQAHPYREAPYIDHIRLYPRDVHGVEVINASLGDIPNCMAALYAQQYGLLTTAGSDNHQAGACPRLAGLRCQEPLSDIQDFIQKVKDRQMEIFTLDLST